MTPEELVAKKVLENNIKTRKELLRVKRELSIKDIPKNSAVYLKLPENKRKEYSSLFLKKPVRKNSGVYVVTVMCKPHSCPHGRCVYCPISLDPKNPTPPSYTGFEPASMRGKLVGWDPYKQVQNRLKQYYDTGHFPEKIELIVNGGTFNTIEPEKDYPTKFLTECYRALNDYPKNKEYETSILEAKKANQKSKQRMVALVLETRPTTITKKEVEKFLKWGVTRIELGVQNLNDLVLKMSGRAHGVKEVIKATELLKQAGFKTDYHMMLGLPKTSLETDIEMFEELFKNPEYKPDGLKIYPTMLIKNTLLYKWYEKGLYTPIDEDRVIKTLLKIKPIIPKYVKIKRILRDIPITRTEKGVRKGNIREILWKEMKEKKIECNCIRCREAGHTTKKIEKITMTNLTYEASKGIEHFISFEDKKNNILISMLRLRLDDNATVREIHTYGSTSEVKGKTSTQHQGFGKKLLKKAEKIAKQENYEKIRIISGVGVRQYYEKLGYVLKEPYMIKYF